MKAIWNDTVLAESDATLVIEGNHYFPPDSIRRDFFGDAEKTTYCGRKGSANYYDITVDDEVNPAAAWYYPKPMEEAAHLRNYVAFWSGVQIVE